MASLMQFNAIYVVLHLDRLTSRSFSCQGYSVLNTFTGAKFAECAIHQ